MEFTELSAEQVAELAASSGGPSYADVVRGFLATDMAGVVVNDKFPGKKASTIVSGLKNAISKNDLTAARAVANGEQVALIRT